MLVIPDRAKAMILPPLSFRSEARNLVVPDRVKGVKPPPLSFRSDSEKSRVAEDVLLGADDGCMRSLPCGSR